MLEMSRSPLPVFVTTTVFAALLLLTVWVPNCDMFGLAVTIGIVPVPLRAMVCGLPVALSVTDRLALRAPAAPGLNEAWTVRLVFATTVTGNAGGLTSEKSAAFAPDIEIALMTRLALPLLLMVTAWIGGCAGGGLTSWFPKLSAGGETLKPGDCTVGVEGDPPPPQDVKEMLKTITDSSNQRDAILFMC